MYKHHKPRIRDLDARFYGVALTEAPRVVAAPNRDLTAHENALLLMLRRQREAVDKKDARRLFGAQLKLPESEF